MAPNLEILLLGGLQIRQNGAAVVSFMSSKVPALLAYLAVTGRPHQRDALAGLLWGEMPDVAAANNLRQALSNLRKLFEPHRLSKAPQLVRQELRRLLLRQMIPDDADVRYQTLFLDRYMADDQAAIAAEHSVHLGWAPGVPVYLFHGRDDLTVPYAAATSALRTLQAAGARDISLTDCTTPDYGHLKCVPEYFRFAVERMGRLARDL